MDPLRPSNFTYRPNRSATPADNTRVAPQPIFKEEKASSFPMSETQKQLSEALAKNPPRQHYISQARPVPEPARKAQAAQRRRQENLNKMYQADPFAAQVNGLRNFGTPSNPQVEKIGPTVLEGTALLHPLGNFTLGTVNTAKQVVKTVKDPSLGNIGLAALEVVGTASPVAGKIKGPLAATKPVRALAHGKVSHTAHRIHEVMTVGKGLNQVSGVSAPLKAEPPMLDAGPTLRNLEIKKQIGDSAWSKLWTP
jgi:hypothetical protein